MKVKEVMSEYSVKYCTPETKLTEAVKAMKDGHGAQSNRKVVFRNIGPTNDSR